MLHELGACLFYTDFERKAFKAKAQVKPYLIQLDNISTMSVFEFNEFGKRSY